MTGAARAGGVHLPSRRASRFRVAGAPGYWLSAPALLYLFIFFLLPLGIVLLQAVRDDRFSAAFPQSADMLRHESDVRLPSETVLHVFVSELAKSRADKTISGVDRRIAQEDPALQGLFAATARKLPGGQAQATMQDTLGSIDKRWADPATWMVIRRAAANWTPTYLLMAIDHTRDASGQIVPRPAEQAIYLAILWKSITISLIVTLLTVILGMPLAFLMAHATPTWRTVLFIAVQIPFWTSILVRLSAWTVLLQNQGLLNQLLHHLGLVDAPIEMMYNRFAVYVAMTHVQLPLMILPAYGVMQGIKENYVRAALSLGASPLRAFATVYLPLAAPGVGAGSVLVFISSLGYYITPAIVGGAGDQMISYFVQFHLDKLNWGLAAALASIMIVTTGLVVLVARIASRAYAASR